MSHLCGQLRLKHNTVLSTFHCDFCLQNDGAIDIDAALVKENYRLNDEIEALKITIKDLQVYSV